MKHIISIVAFMVVTFAVQGTSHFVLNADHYAGITHLRPEPIMPLGFAAMIIQGAILSLLLERSTNNQATIKDGLFVSMMFGIFLGSYMWLAEPAKYAVPSITAWISVELPVNLIQFAVYGMIIGFIHQRFTKQVAAEPA